MNKPRSSASKPSEMDAVIRVSRRNGRDGDSFLSPDLQREIIQRDADQHGYTIRKWWDETDSVSGKTTNRKGLQGAMAACKSGESDGIVVARVDRFARNLPQGLTAIRELHEAGKHFVAVNDGVRGNSSRGPAKALLTLLLMFAEWQLESITDGWLSARASCVERGVAGHIVAYGYRKGEDRRLVPDKAEAKIVVRIFTERAAGAGLQVIADGLTADGVANPSGGPRWSHSTVGNLLGRRVYLGELVEVDKDGDVIMTNRNAHPAIVDLKLWEAVESRAMVGGVRRTRGETRRVALLAGIARCGSCGGKMRERNSTVNGVTYRHYRCGQNFGWGRCENPANCLAADLEEIVLDQFAADFLATDFDPADVAGDEGLAAALVELDEANADLEAYMVSNATMQRKRPAAYDKGLKAKDAEVDRCEALVAELRQTARGARLPKGIASAWPDMDAIERREHLSACYGAVVVWPGEVRGAALDGRAYIFRPDETNPMGLPGRGVEDNALTPIEWPFDD